MSELDTAVSAVDSAVEAIRALGESKKVNAMVRKLTIVLAELQAELTRERVMATVPTTPRKKSDV